MENKKRSKTQLAVFGLLLLTSTIFVLLETWTHWLFFGHLGAIPLEILFGALMVEKFLEKKEKEEKLGQLMYIKSYLFRSEMRNLFILNFDALTWPDVSMTTIKEANLDELMAMRAKTDTIKYRSIESLEPVIQEYATAHGVFYGFMEWAIQNNIEAIFKDMIYILHFIQDVKLFNKNHPGKLFIHEAMARPALMEKVKHVLKDGIVKFIEYAIELKVKQPKVFNELMGDYELSSLMHKQGMAKFADAKVEIAGHSDQAQPAAEGSAEEKKDVNGDKSAASDPQEAPAESESFEIGVIKK